MVAILTLVIFLGVIAVLGGGIVKRMSELETSEAALEAENRRLDTGLDSALECLQRVADGQPDPESDARNTIELVNFTTNRKKEINK